MLEVLDGQGMQAADRETIEEIGIPGLVLMENAGVQAVEVLLDQLPEPPAAIAVLCGKGNNGGDGLVIARHLYNLGRQVVVFLLAEPEEVGGDAATNLRIVQSLGLPLVPLPDEDAWQDRSPDLGGFDCIVDAMLGTGIDSAARGVVATAIGAVNRSGVPVVAVDLPSGMSASSGHPPGDCVVADLTVTFGALKCCHVLEPASEMCGHVSLVDISIPQRVLAGIEPVLRLLEPDDWKAVLPGRRPTGHKGDYGRVLIIGGAPGMAGACVLAARGALRGGAGLVHVACPDSVYGPVASQLVEALVHGIETEGGVLGPEAAERLGELVEGMDVVALGPGIGGAEPTARLVRWLARELERPMVIDADGLNGLGGAIEELREAPAPRLLTPHPGEAGRLLGSGPGEVQADRPAALDSLVTATGATILLKGHRTLVGGPDRVPVINCSGNPGMATGGTGDVLTGLAASLVGQGLETFEAAWCAACLHGRAGDLAAERLGMRGVIAGDLVDFLTVASGHGDGIGDGRDA